MHVGSAPEAVKLNSSNGLPIDGTNPLPTTGGGGGGGSLADVLLTDTAGALFVARDNGTTVTYFNLNTNAVYTPVGTIYAPSSGGGGGSALADVLLTDGTGALFVSRDNGISVTYFNLNTNAVYTPSGTIKPATLTDAQLRATALPVSGIFYQATQPVSIAASVSVTGPLTDTQLRAVAVPVSGTVTATGPLTDTQLRATAVPVSGTLAVTGPLTDTQLRATAVPVSGTFFQATQPVSGTVTATGPLTNTELRATAVPVSGPLTNTELRAASVPVIINPMTALSYNVAGVIAINTTLISVDCSQVRTITMQCVSMGTTGAVTYQFSNDQVTWTNATYQTSTGTTASGTITAVGISFITVLARYFRVQLTTATTAGTTTFTGFSADRPANLPITTQSVTGTVTATATQPFTPTASLLSSAATTNATSVKATAGTIYAISASNVGAAAAFLKIFNLATAPTVGTSVPALTIPIPATGQISLEFGPLGLRFGTGISFSITNLIADADTTAIVAAQVKLIISYV